MYYVYSKVIKKKNKNVYSFSGTLRGVDNNING